MRKYLITGGAGFIASHIVDTLIAKKHRVVIVDNLSTGKKRNLNPKAKFYRLDIRSKKLVDVFKKEKPDGVFHLAAQMNLRKSIEDPVFDADVNIAGSINLLENCIKYKVKKVVFASTGGALYGSAKRPTPETAEANPESPYGIAKYTIEKYLDYYRNVHGLKSVSIRPGNVYGPRQNHMGEAGVVSIFAHNLLNNKHSYINGDGRQTRDFVYVGDAADAFIRAMTRKKEGSYNLGTSEEISVNKVYKELSKIVGGRFIAPDRKPAIEGEVRRSSLSYKKIQRDLGWKPRTSLQKGLKKTVEYFITRD